MAPRGSCLLVTTPPLYPTNQPHRSLAAIRFASPVRVSHIHILPDGVGVAAGPAHGQRGGSGLVPQLLGTTHPPQWTGELFVHVAPADPEPVNAMVRSEVVYDAGRGDWPVELEIGMPDGVSTRLIVLATPATAVTLAIYGYTLATDRAIPPPLLPSLTKTDLTSAWDWAGGVDGLLVHIARQNEYAARALESLHLAPREQLREALPSVPRAVPHVLAVGAFAHVFDTTPSVLLSPDIAPLVPPSHPAHPVCSVPPDDRGGVAWYHLDVPLARFVLANSRRGTSDGNDLLECPPPYNVGGANRVETRSKMVLLVEEAYAVMAAEDADAAAVVANDTTRDTLASLLALLEPPPVDPTARAYLARRLPRLYVYLHAHASTGPQAPPLPTSLAGYERTTLEHLVACATEPRFLVAARALAAPILHHLGPSDPLRAVLSNPSAESSSPAASTSASTSPDPAIRAQHRLLSHLTQPRPSALTHDIPPAELLRLIAPELHASLARARLPPLGISPFVPGSGSGSRGAGAPGAQASDYAGKVYTSHEFRNREGQGHAQGQGQGRERNGAVSPVPTLMATGHGHGPGRSVSPGMDPAGHVAMGGMGMGMGMGTALGGGIGAAGGRMSRPASRHVDDFAR